MPWGNMGGSTAIVILIIVLLLFGAPKLPALARSLGQSMKILKKEVTSDKDADAKGDQPAAGAEPAVSGVADPAEESAADELARAKAEAAAAKAEAEALRAAAQKRTEGSEN